MPSRVTANVKMLDGKVQSYAVQLKSNGSALIDDIMKDLNVLEADYFGIQYKDKGENLMFLDPAKRIEEQLKNPPKLLFHFVVRFYPHNPSELEEHTRYLIGLQIKQDISDNLYKCERNILVYMLAAIVQSVYGNHELPQGATIDYVENLNILPKTDIEEPHQLLEEIRQKHIEMRNMTPNEADSKLLDVACKLEHYGMRYHPAKDKNGSHLKLSVSHAGVVVFQGDARKEFHSWPRIRKLAFKKNKMLLKMKNESAPTKKGDVIVFTMSSRDASKNFWRSCIEHFSFFRLEAQPKPKPKPVVFKRGSTFRYSGRTHKQLYEMKRSNTTRAQRSDFERINVKSSKNAVTNPVAASCSDVGAESSNAGAISIHDPTTAVNEEPQQAASVVELTKIEEEVATSNTAPTVEDDNDAKANGPESGEDSKDAVTADDREDWQVESGDLHSNTAKLATATAVTREEDGDEVEDKHEDDNKRNQHPVVTTSYKENRSSMPSPATLHSSASGQHCNDSVTSSNIISTHELKSTNQHSTRHHNNSSVAYYIIKELLTTERTFCRDLDVLCSEFKMAMREENEKWKMMSEQVCDSIFEPSELIVQHHRSFLAKLEQNMQQIELNDDANTSLEELVHEHVTNIEGCRSSIEKCEASLSTLEELCAKHARMETCYREFELQKVCYIPLGSFLLKPMQRIIHYKQLLERLQRHCHDKGLKNKHYYVMGALYEATTFCNDLQHQLNKAINTQKMSQLRRDLIGVDNLLSDDRMFIREGSLYKLSRKGFQQRLFFLFTDCLLYTSKGVTSTNQFKVHTSLPLHGMLIEINEGEKVVPNCFSIISGDKVVIAAASSQNEMNKWLEDFSVAISRATRYDATAAGHRTPLDKVSLRGSQISVQSSDDNTSSSIKSGSGGGNQQRSNTTMHVCWHRNTSVSAADHIQSLRNQLSGYLLRKFKNSNGWQKLWVVFTNFCLFFYKSHHDQFPLASLPLLGYTVTTPSHTDEINKDYVFKLQFKTHVYFFRAESQYTFDRWMQVVNSTTSQQQTINIFPTN